MLSNVSIAMVVLCLLTALLTLCGASPVSRDRHLVNDDETKVSVIFGALADDHYQGQSVHTRNKRSADHPASEGFDPISAIESDSSLSPSQRRQRRSAVLYLHASIQFCKNYPRFCRRIEIDEGDVKVKVRLEDM